MSWSGDAAGASAPAEAAHGSVEIWTSAKGQVQWRIKSYVTDSADDMQAARLRAIDEHDQLVERFGKPTGG